MIWVVARARGLLIFAGVLLASAVAAWVAGRVQANLPLADGPRYLRQYLVAFLPAGMGPALPDRLPGLSATLLREPLLRRCTLLLYWGGLGLVLGPGWVSRPGQLTTYEIMTCLVLGTVVLAVTARWGSTGCWSGCYSGWSGCWPGIRSESRSAFPVSLSSAPATRSWAWPATSRSCWAPLRSRRLPPASGYCDPPVSPPTSRPELR